MTAKVLEQARHLIAEFLKTRRTALGLSQQGLADLCGFHRNTVANIEAGKFWPNMKQFMILTHHLRCFFFLETHESQSPTAAEMKNHWRPGDPGSAIRGTPPKN